MSFNLSDEMETNEMARIGEEKDEEPLKVVIKKRMKAVCEVMKEPIVRKYYLFLLFLGLQPDFGSFGYYFLLDVCHVSKFEISILTI